MSKPRNKVREIYPEAGVRTFKGNYRHSVVFEMGKKGGKVLGKGKNAGEAWFNAYHSIKEK
jgi:hypothetical protein